VGSKENPVFTKASNLTHELMKIVMESPISALSLEIADLSDEIHIGDSMKIKINFRSIGSESVTFPHPQTWTETEIGLGIRAGRSDIPLAERTTEATTMFDLSADSTTLKIPGHSSYCLFRKSFIYNPIQYLIS